MPGPLDSSTFEQASLQGRVTVQNQKDGGQIVTASSSNRLKDWAVQWLAKFDWAAEKFDFVKNYRSENSEALKTFLETLSREFGKRAGNKAGELIPSDGTIPLTARTVQQLTRAAHTFGGSGDARLNTHNVAVQIWPYKGMAHPGHASLTIGTERPQHVSWWPAGKTTGAFDRVFAEAPSEEQDKILETSTETSEKLDQGRIARQKLALGIPFDEPVQQELEHAAAYMPRANQVYQDGTWGTLPDTMYLPVVGQTVSAKDGRTHCVLFGLDSSAMSKHWEEMQKQAFIDPTDGTNALSVSGSGDPEALSRGGGYRLISKEENCAAAVIRTLQAGGSDHFTPPPKVLVSFDPNNAAAFAEQLQAGMDRLNGIVDTIHTAARAEAENPAVAHRQRELQGMSDSTFREHMEREIEKAELTEAQKTALNQALNAFSKLSETPTVSEIIPQAKEMVEALNDFQEASGKPEGTFLSYANEMLTRVEEKMVAATGSDAAAPPPPLPRSTQQSQQLKEELEQKLDERERANWMKSFDN